MARAVALSVLLVSAPLFAAPAPPGPDARADARKMQGTWSVVTATEPGRTPEDFLKKVKFVFDKDTLTLTVGPAEKPFKFKLVVNKGRGEIDILPHGDVHVAQGLFKFEKDQLTLTFFKPGKGRPTKFGDSEAMTVVLKKDK
jgi:uncharacterized protein (TIGR03067 family)